MHWRNTPNAWGGLAKLFHWMMALALFGMVILGWVMVNWPLSPLKFSLYFVHKSLGIVLLMAVAIRLGWRLINPTPRLHRPPYEQWLAYGAHMALYGVMIALPISGWVLNSATNFPLSVFGWFILPPLVAPNPELKVIAKDIHVLLVWAFLFLVVMHMAAALRHHIVLKDDVLVRMLPRFSRKDRFL